MSGGSARSRERNRSKRSPIRTGSTLVIPRQKQTAELAAEPRPWQRMSRSRQKRTISTMVRKYPSYSSSRISASSFSTCRQTASGIPSG